jgi:G3E family GTPase
MIIAQAYPCVIQEVAMRAGIHAVDTASPIPLTVVGGPSGAGKSAVIRHLVEDQVGRRVVVVVPQVAGATDGHDASVQAGDVRLEWIGDSMMLPSRDPVDDLLQLARMERRPDHVIVEAHGDESPARLVGYAYMPGYRPNGVIIVVDAAVGARMEAGETLGTATQAQLRRADLVVLNKVDLAGPRVAAATQRTLAKLAPSARFLWSHGGQVASSVLVGPTAGYVAPNETSVVAEWRADYEPVSTRDGRSRLAERCRTWCLVSERPLEARAFRDWVAKLPGTVMRGSGVVHLREEPQHRQDFALIGSRWRLTRGAPWGSTAPLTRVTLVSVGGEMRRAAGTADTISAALGESAPPAVRRRIQLQESSVAVSEGESR